MHIFSIENHVREREKNGRPQNSIVQWEYGKTKSTNQRRKYERKRAKQNVIGCSLFFECGRSDVPCSNYVVYITVCSAYWDLYQPIANILNANLSHRESERIKKKNVEPLKSVIQTDRKKV